MLRHNRARKTGKQAEDFSPVVINYEQTTGDSFSEGKTSGWDGFRENYSNGLYPFYSEEKGGGVAKSWLQPRCSRAPELILLFTQMCHSSGMQTSKYDRLCVKNTGEYKVLLGKHRSVPTATLHVGCRRYQPVFWCNLLLTHDVGCQLISFSWSVSKSRPHMRVVSCVSKV